MSFTLTQEHVYTILNCLGMAAVAFCMLKYTKHTVLHANSKFFAEINELLSENVTTCVSKTEHEERTKARKRILEAVTKGNEQLNKMVKWTEADDWVDPNVLGDELKAKLAEIHDRILKHSNESGVSRVF